MFASLSRRSSNVSRSYICSSCLCNILTPPIPSTPLHSSASSRQALFSTTTAAYSEDGGESTDTPATAAPGKQGAKAKPSHNALRTKKARLRQLLSHRMAKVSKSSSTLGALRDSLQADEEALNSKGEENRPQKKPRPPKKPKPVASADITLKDSKKASSSPEHEQDVSSSVVEPERSPKSANVNSKSTKPANKKKPVNDNSKAASVNSKSTKPVNTKKPVNDKNSKAASASKDPPVKIRRPVVKPKGPVKIPIASDHVRRTIQRRTLVKAIQDGNLPEKERRDVLRSLRNSLLTKVELDFKLDSKKPIEQGLKAAMLRGARPPSRYPREGTEYQSSGSPFQQEYPQKRVGIEVPYKVGAPRAENKAPIPRAAPGPVKHTPPPRHLSQSMTAYEIETVEVEKLELTAIDSGPLDVPKLAYGLERVLFNPGVYQLQDPRTRVFNFDPYLQTIMPVDEFDFNALKQYVTSSRDDTLLQKAADEKKKYTGSTSSMTSALGHFHFLLSQWRLINVGNLSKMFPVQFHTFTAFQRVPTAIFLRYKNGTYAIDADKQFDSASVLSMLGKSMEKLLTLPTDRFEKYRKGKSDQITEEERNEPEAFHYTTMGDFLMRSQLDAYDERLPGTGMFDLKTRAVISIRMDTDAYEEGRGYQIRHRHGEWESFEREYYDMIRAAFLKYSLQVRMGRMDGIFVAFHNTERIFGFQYISLEEMDYAIHGTDDRRLGDAEFKLSVDLLNRVLDRATAKYPEKSLRLHFETRDAVTPFMYIFAEPVEEAQIEEIQASNADQIEEFEKQVLGLHQEELDQQKKQAQWDEIRARVEKEMHKDEHEPEDVEIEDMTEEERHQIQALVSSNALPEDLRETEEGEEDDDVIEGIVTEEMEELDDEHEEYATGVADNGEIVEDGEIGVDSEESTSIIESEHDSDTSNTLVSADIEESGIEEVDESAVEEADIEETATANDAEADNVIYEDAGTDADEKVVVDDEADDTAAPKPEFDTHNADGSKKDILAMTLIIQNKVDGKYVAQPDADNYLPGSKWEVEYALAEVEEPERAFTLYSQCRLRRKKVYSKSIDLSANMFQDKFLQKIKNLSKEGRKWRDEQKEIEDALPVKTLEESLKGMEIKSKDLKDRSKPLEKGNVSEMQGDKREASEPEGGK